MYSINGVFQSFDLFPASVHDIHYLKDLKTQLSDCVLLGNKGCLSQSIQFDLFIELISNYKHSKELIKKSGFILSKNIEKGLIFHGVGRISLISLANKINFFALYKDTKYIVFIMSNLAKIWFSYINLL